MRILGHPRLPYSLRKSSTNDNDSNTSDDANGNSSVTPEEGILLDPETYLQAENLVQPDGSLSLGGNSQQLNPLNPRINNKVYQSAVDGLFSPPPRYEYVVLNDGGDATPNTRQPKLSDDELLYKAMMNIETNEERIDPEELHRQVFAEEQGYLNQSEEFRKSLSTLYRDDEIVESPMAKERRETIEQYNEEVLEDLLKEIDEMEKMTLSREDAMLQARQGLDAKSSSNAEDKSRSKQTKGVLCTNCGLRVTPDMIQRVQMIEIAKGGEVKQTQQYPKGILCLVCYGSQFRTTKEAEVRIGRGYYGDSSSKMWEKKSIRPRGKSNDSYGREWSSNGGRRGDRSSGSGFDTSSMFDISKGDGRNRSNQPSVPTRRLGGLELVNRMKQRESESERSEQLNNPMLNDDTPTLSPPLPLTVDTNSKKQGQKWEKVIDPQSQRTVYWNKATGEMRKNAPE